MLVSTRARPPCSCISSAGCNSLRNHKFDQIQFILIPLALSISPIGGCCLSTAISGSRSQSLMLHKQLELFNLCLVLSQMYTFRCEMFSIDTKSGTESRRNIVNEYKLNPLLPGSLVGQCRDTETHLCWFLASDNRAADVGVMFRHTTRVRLSRWFQRARMQSLLWWLHLWSRINASENLVAQHQYACFLWWPL